MSGTPVHGTVEPGFEPVREVFERSFEKGELGAAVCAYVDGRKVVDLWGGWADAAKTREWQRDTIACIYSATKAMTATCAHRLIERGLLDVDEPVATYWPEFAQAGKENITVRMVLSHQAGLPWRDGALPEGQVPRLGHDHRRTRPIDPVWEPGTKREYHGGTFGYLVGEVVRRIDGRSLGTYFREEIAEPLGADFMIDFGPEHDHRCAEMVGDDDMVGNTRSGAPRATERRPAAARPTGFARVFAALARGGELDGVQVLRAETIEAAIQEQPLRNAGGTAGEFGLGYSCCGRCSP